MVEAGADHPGVSAKLCLPVVQGLLLSDLFLQSLLVNGNRPSQEPAWRHVDFLISVQFSHSDFLSTKLFSRTINPTATMSFDGEGSASYPPIPNFVFARVMS